MEFWKYRFPRCPTFVSVWFILPPCHLDIYRWINRFTETYLAKEIDAFIETVEKKHDAHVFMMVGYPTRDKTVEMTT